MKCTLLKTHKKQHSFKKTFFQITGTAKRFVQVSLVLFAMSVHHSDSISLIWLVFLSPFFTMPYYFLMNEPEKNLQPNSNGEKSDNFKKMIKYVYGVSS
jgi:hypothetical protein